MDLAAAADLGRLLQLLLPVAAPSRCTNDAGPLSRLADAWNSGKLPARFYEGQVGGSGRTGHAWAFKVR